MTSKMDIINMVKFITSRLPRFAPKYDAQNYVFYCDLDVAKISNYMINNWQRFFNSEKNGPSIHIVIDMYGICGTTSKKVIDELKDILFDVIQEYIEDEKPDVCNFNETDMINYLTNHLDLRINDFVFKKTANTCTPYGFI